MLSASVGPSNALLLSSGIASSAFAKPLGAAAPLRIGPVEDLVPPGELRVIGVGEMLGDDALEVGVDHGPVQRPPFADDPIGERDPALRPSPTRASTALRCRKRLRPQIHALGDQQVEGTHTGHRLLARLRGGDLPLTVPVRVDAVQLTQVSGPESTSTEKIAAAIDRIGGKRLPKPATIRTG